MFVVAASACLSAASVWLSAASAIYHSTDSADGPEQGPCCKAPPKDPDQFTDANHKPEIALALGPFEAFVGFKPLETIEKLFQLEPLQQFLPKIKKPDFDDQTLKHIVEALLKESEDEVKNTNKALLDLPTNNFGNDTYIPELIPRLAKQYNIEDNGTLVALLTMNYLQLNEGDSIYIPADGIHAYLSGDIIECMARSDNVLNTGFCPRADRNNIDTFVGCLTFRPHETSEAILKPRTFDGSRNGKTQIYAPPMSEFNMLVTTLDDGESDAIRAIGGPSIMIVTEGEGTLKADGNEHRLSAGYIFFIGQGIELEMSATKTLKAFAAHAE